MRDIQLNQLPNNALIKLNNSLKTGIDSAITHARVHMLRPIATHVPVAMKLCWCMWCERAPRKIRT